jgi:hypothetical protein
MSFIDTDSRCRNKGTIDLVRGRCRGRNDVPQDDRGALSWHTILAEEFGEDAATQGASHCWVFDPTTHQQLRARAADLCSSLALEIDGKGEIGAIYDPTEGIVCRRARRRSLPQRVAADSMSTRRPGAIDAGDGIYDIHERIPVRLS